MSKEETPDLSFFENTVDPDQLTYDELFSTLIENTCLQQESCRLTGYKFGRSVVHKNFSMASVKVQPYYRNSLNQLFIYLYFFRGEIGLFTSKNVNV